MKLPTVATAPLLNYLDFSGFARFSMTAMGKILVVAAVLISAPADGAEYDCSVSRKLDTENEYSAQHVARFKFSVRIDEKKDVSFLSRCSFSSSDSAMACDRYQVDKVVYDEVAKIKKFYVFRSQFDVQIFPNMTFVENNGRGGIAFGTCNLTAP